MSEQGATGSDHQQRERDRATVASAWQFEGSHDLQPTQEEYCLWCATKLHRIGATLRGYPECLSYLRNLPDTPWRNWLLGAANDCPPSLLHRQLLSLTTEHALRCYLWFGIEIQNLADVIAHHCNDVPRVDFDAPSLFITLDGVRHGPLSPQGFGIFFALYQSMSQARDRPVPWKELQESVPGCKGDDKTLRRHIKELPEQLRGCIKSKRAAGRWLVLPPKK
jgi:hypothetical protein